MIRLKTPYSFNENIHLLENIRAWLDMPTMTPEYQVLNAVIELLKATTKPKDGKVQEE